MLPASSVSTSPYARGVVHRRQHDRRARLALAVQPQHGRQVHLGQHVAVEHDDRLGERVAGIAHGAAGAERRRLDDVADLDADARAVAEHVLDPPRLVVQAEDDFVDLRHLLQQVDLVVQKRPIEDRHDRLGRVERERPQPRAFAPGEQDGLHDNRRSYPMRHRSGCTGSIRVPMPPELQCPRAAPMNLPNALTSRGSSSSRCWWSSC